MSASEPKELSATAALRSKVSGMRARDARGRKTMALLHKAMIELIEQQPFEKITVDDLIRHARVGRSTFYRHYADTEALMAEIAESEITRLMSLALPMADPSNSLDTCRRIVADVAEHRRLWSALLTGGAASVMRHHFLQLTTPSMDTSRPAKPGMIPADLSASSGVAATVEILAWWMKYPERATQAQVAEYLDLLAVRPGLTYASAETSTD